MGLIIYLDGEYVAEEDAKLSVFDHGVLYGDGVFEGIRAYYGRVFRLQAHIDRLYDSARYIGLDPGLTKEEMTRVVIDTCRRNNLSDAYIRLVVTRGKGDLGLDPRNCSRPTVFCIAAAIELYPAELYEKGLDLVTLGTRRTAPDALDPRIKSLNYLNNILAKMEAIRAGAPEGLFLNKEGYVAEATGDNIFIIKNGSLYTPPPHIGLLEGVTRNTIMELAAGAGIPVFERVFTLYEVYNADECFLTGTAAEAIPVVRVDGRPVGNGQPGPITRDLIAMFRELTKSDGPEIFA